MAKIVGSKKAIEKNPAVVKREQEKSKSLAVINHGVTNSLQARDLMLAIASDLITGALAANVGSGVCNAIGKLLKIVEMEFKYGPKGPDATTRFLVLGSPTAQQQSESAN